MIRSYLLELKAKGNFTIQSVSELSGISESTVANVFNGTTPDPRFDTVLKMVTAMGGTLEFLYAPKKVEEIETNAIISLKESYEARIAELKRDKRILGIVCGALVSAVLLLLILDFCIGSHGWVLF